MAAPTSEPYKVKVWRGESKTFRKANTDRCSPPGINKWHVVWTFYQVVLYWPKGDCTYSTVDCKIHHLDTGHLPPSFSKSCDRKITVQNIALLHSVPRMEMEWIQMKAWESRRARREKVFIRCSWEHEDTGKIMWRTHVTVKRTRRGHNISATPKTTQGL